MNLHLTPPSVLGESPLLIDDSRLVTVDMLSGIVRSTDIRDGREAWYRHVAPPEVPYVGAVVQTAGEDLAAVTLDGIVRVPASPSEPVEGVATIVDGTRSRLNDAAVDPLGRLWVGSTALDGTAGAGMLHVWRPGTAPQTVLTGLTLPNGIGWSPDGATAYVVDSGRRVILRADVADDGEIGVFTVFAQLDAEPGGEPDGLAVADDGSVWVAIWDGGRIERYTSDGVLREAVRVPVTRPTACAIGDRELFVTSARHGLADNVLDNEPLAGSIVRIPVDVSGVAQGRLAL